jgi:hypothetical protein
MHQIGKAEFDPRTERTICVRLGTHRLRRAGHARGRSRAPHWSRPPTLAAAQDIPLAFSRASCSTCAAPGCCTATAASTAAMRWPDRPTDITGGRVVRAVGGALTTVRGLPTHTTTYHGAATGSGDVWVAVEGHRGRRRPQDPRRTVPSPEELRRVSMSSRTLVRLPCAPPPCLTATPRRCGWRRHSPRPVRRSHPSRVFPEHHARPALVGRQQGLLPAGAGQHQARGEDLQRRAGRASRRCSPARSTPRTSARTRRSTAGPVQGHRPEDHRGSTSGGAGLVVKQGINTAGRPQGQEDRHPAAGQHPGRRAARLAQAERPERRPAGRRRRVDRPAGQRDALQAFAQGAIDGAWVPSQLQPDAARVRGQGAGQREGPVAERASSSPPT